LAEIRRNAMGGGAMRFRAALCAVVFSGVMAPAASGQVGQGPLTCVFDRLPAPDRVKVADGVLGGEPGDAKSGIADAALDTAAKLCLEEHRWDARHAGLSRTYAMHQAVQTTLEQDFEKAGVPAGRIKAVWTALSAEDRTALRAEDISDALTEKLLVQLKEAGVPNNPLDMLEAYSNLSALSEIAAVEQAWRTLAEPRPGS